MREFMGTSVENLFGDTGELCDIVENGREISKRTFLKYCATDPELRVAFKEFPNDYQFYKSRRTLSHRPVYYYEWSAIKHFYL